jgi:thiol-disulfide isomerase/thioredoxin
MEEKPFIDDTVLMIMLSGAVDRNPLLVYMPQDDDDEDAGEAFDFGKWWAGLFAIEQAITQKTVGLIDGNMDAGDKSINIHNVNIAEKDGIVTVTWETDKPANGILMGCYGSTCAPFFDTNTELTTSHVVVVDTSKYPDGKVHFTNLKSRLGDLGSDLDVSWAPTNKDLILSANMEVVESAPVMKSPQTYETVITDSGIPQVSRVAVKTSFVNRAGEFIAVMTKDRGADVYRKAEQFISTEDPGLAQSNRAKLNNIFNTENGITHADLDKNIQADTTENKGTGKNVYVVIFSGFSWCNGCQIYTPQVADSIIKALNDKGIQVFYLSSDGANEAYSQEFANKYGINRVSEPRMAIIQNGKKVGNEYI